MIVHFTGGPLEGRKDYPNLLDAPSILTVVDGRPKPPTEPVDPLTESYYIDVNDKDAGRANYNWRKWRLESFGDGGIKVRMEEPPNVAFTGMKDYTFHVTTKYERSKRHMYDLVARFEGVRVVLMLPDEYAPCFTHITNPIIQEGPPSRG